MQELQSSLTAYEGDYGELKPELEAMKFSLGGNWDYDHGYFDRALDEGQKLWLRLPFEVTGGRLDSEVDNAHTTVKFMTPFVLKHVYNEGLDGEAAVGTTGLINQFQSPEDKNASLSPGEVDAAGKVLREVEDRLLDAH